MLRSRHAVDARNYAPVSFPRKEAFRPPPWGPVLPSPKFDLPKIGDIKSVKGGTYSHTATCSPLACFFYRCASRCASDV
jgi:hypothetical protein